MTISFGFFHDSALTQPIDSGNPITAVQYTDGSLPDTDKLIYFGSPDSGTKARDAADPGVTPISVSIADSASGSGAPSTEFKLALSLIGLGTATAGAALELGTEVLSGVANAVPIYTRRHTSLTAVAAYSDLSLTTQSLTELPAP